MRVLGVFLLAVVAASCTEPKAEASYVGTWTLSDTADFGGTWFPVSTGSLILRSDQTFSIDAPGGAGKQAGDWELASDGEMIELHSASGFVGQQEPHAGYSYLLIGKALCCPSYRFRK